MTPREQLASPVAIDRARARDVIANRLRLGWDRDRAETEPTGKPRKARTLDARAPTRKASLPRDGVIVDHETPYDDDDRAWYVVSAHPDGLTLDEIGALLGLTRERVRQIEAGAFRKLRAALEREDLTAHDVGAWLSTRRESEPDRTVPIGKRSAHEGGRGHVWVAQVPPGAYSDSVLRAAAECDAGIASIAETAQARRDVARVVEGMEM